MLLKITTGRATTYIGFKMNSPTSANVRLIAVRGIAK